MINDANNIELLKYKKETNQTIPNKSFYKKSEIKPTGIVLNYNVEEVKELIGVK